MTNPNNKQQPPNADTLYAVALGRFSLWAIDLARNPDAGVPLVGPEQREWIAAAAQFIRETLERENEIRRQNRANGKLGGRPITDNPAPSTVRSRKSRARKKDELYEVIAESGPTGISYQDIAARLDVLGVQMTKGYILSYLNRHVKAGALNRNNGKYSIPAKL